MSYNFISTLTASEAALKMAEVGAVLRRKAHLPANVDQLADAIALQLAAVGTFTNIVAGASGLELAIKHYALTSELVNVAAGLSDGTLGRTNLVFSDSADATVAAMISATGSLGVALGGIHAPIGTIFNLGQATNDTTDNALIAAKGGALDQNDVFVVDSSTSVLYLAAS